MSSLSLSPTDPGPRPAANRALALTLLLVLSAWLDLGFLVGCAPGSLLRAAGLGGRSDRARWTTADVAQAESSADAAALDSMCANRTKPHADSSVAWTEACHARIRLAIEADDVERLEAVCHRRMALRGGQELACADLFQRSLTAWGASIGSCEDLGAAYAEHGTRIPHQHRTAFHLEAARSFAACGDWAGLLEHLIWRPEGSRMLLAAEDEGHAPAEPILDLLGSEPQALAEVHAGPGTASIVRFLLTRGHRDHCERAVAIARRAPPRAVDAWLHYAAEVGCSEATPLAAARLDAFQAADRLDGCKVLGRLGEREHLNAVSTLARTDPHKRVERIDGHAVLTYPVREACRAAAGRIALRSR